MRNTKKGKKMFTVTEKSLEISNWSICFSTHTQKILCIGSLVTSSSLYLQIISIPQHWGFPVNRFICPNYRNPQRILTFKTVA